MNRLILTLGLFLMLLLTAACQSLETNDPPTEPSQEYQWRNIKKKLAWLIKTPNLNEQVEINEMGIALYRSAGARDSGLVESRIYPDEFELTAKLFRWMDQDSLLAAYEQKGNKHWRKVLSKAQLQKATAYSEDSVAGDSLLPLKGWKIAIDPGHISGDIVSAEMEGKYVKMKASKLTGGKAIGFFEPQLTLVTALIIQDSLKKLGATTLISRPESGKSVKGKSFGLWKKEDWDSVRSAAFIENKWNKEDLSYWQRKADDKEIFKKFYNANDLRARAEKINAFRPDMTLIIHYNIHSPNWDKRDKNGFFVPTQANYSMAFIPGSFAKKELGTSEDRLALLRMLLTSDLYDSYDLSTSFIQHSVTHTGVTPVPKTSDLPYLVHYSIYTDRLGVYARNLSLTRLIYGPLVYGESFCQDNIQEALRLNENDREKNGIAYSSRLEEVAHAYIASVWDFVKEHPKAQKK